MRSVFEGSIVHLALRTASVVIFSQIPCTVFFLKNLTKNWNMQLIHDDIGKTIHPTNFHNFLSFTYPCTKICPTIAYEHILICEIMGAIKETN
jgi:hypothetical protein